MDYQIPVTSKTIGLDDSVYAIKSEKIKLKKQSGISKMFIKTCRHVTVHSVYPYS